jgi:hypothetical protein
MAELPNKKKAHKIIIEKLIFPFNIVLFEDCLTRKTSIKKNGIYLRSGGVIC